MQSREWSGRRPGNEATSVALTTEEEDNDLCLVFPQVGVKSEFTVTWSVPRASKNDRIG